MAPLKIYGDTLSQPVRAVELFCKCNQIEYEPVKMELNQGETRKPHWLQFHPLGKLPVLEEDDFVLSESHTILRYLAITRVPQKDHLYPQGDVKMRCLVDAILDWHHLNLREGCTGYCFATSIGPAHFGVPVNESRAAHCYPKLESSLKTLNDYFLSGPGPFLRGSELTIADYSLACEVEQTRVLSEQERRKLLDPFPRVTAWLEQVKQATAPYWEEIHGKVEAVAEKVEGWRSHEGHKAA